MVEDSHALRRLGPGRRPTIDTVASLAGVSRQTVSNALHTPSLLAPATLRRVLAAVDEVGYRPNSGARALRRQRPTDIACRIPDVQSNINASLYGAYLHELSAALSVVGLGVRLLAAAWGEQEVRLYNDLYLRSEIAAVVLMDPQAHDERVTALRAVGVPVVLYGRPWAGSDVRWVDVDGAAGVTEAIRWCSQRGHRRIGYLGWDEAEGVSRDRERGWRSALDQLDLPEHGLNARGLPDSVATGSRLAATLLDTAQPPTAFICATDVLALGALTTVRERGLRPGEEVAVVGFDDTPTAALAGLSSIRQPIKDAAEATANLVVTEVADDNAIDAGLLVPATLVRRLT
jgi:DNA-binding LacI/PurR family transcriptional regulator